MMYDRAIVHQGFELAIFGTHDFIEEGGVFLVPSTRRKLVEDVERFAVGEEIRCLGANLHEPGRIQLIKDVLINVAESCGRGFVKHPIERNV